MKDILKEVQNLSEEEAKDMLINIIDSSYQYIPWPESQEYMDEPWFENEAILDLQSSGGANYLIPTKYTV